MVQEPQERASIKVPEALNLIDDFAEIGVKSVSLISDGESTLSKAYVPFIQHASNVGIDVGNATNGWEWEPEKIDQVLPHLTWVRFTVAAGTPESYARIMFKSKEHTEVFDRAMKNIKYAVELKKRLNLDVTLGIQMVLMPEFKDEIYLSQNLPLIWELTTASSSIAQMTNLELLVLTMTSTKILFLCSKQQNLLAMNGLRSL